MSVSNKLTEKFITLKTNIDRIDLIKNLNLWGNELEDISYIRELPLLEVVSLSDNNISTLKDFAYLKNLKEIYIRKNNISDFKEVLYLTKCTNLRVLWLNENPIALNPNYRYYVIKILSQIVKLDDIAISSEERKWAEGVEIDFSPYGKLRYEVEDDIYDYRHNRKNINNSNSIGYGIEGNKKMNENLYPNTQSKSNNNQYDQTESSYLTSLSPQLNKQYWTNQYKIVAQNSPNAFDKNNMNNSQQNVNNSNNLYANANNNSSSGFKGNKSASATDINVPKAERKGRTENILNCIVSLMNELNDNELEDIKHDIDQKIKKFNGSR